VSLTAAIATAKNKNESVPLSVRIRNASPTVKEPDIVNALVALTSIKSSTPAAVAEATVVITPILVVVIPEKSAAPSPALVTSTAVAAEIELVTRPTVTRSVTPDIASIAETDISTWSSFAPTKKLETTSIATEPLSAVVPSVANSLASNLITSSAASTVRSMISAPPPELIIS